jgi:capsule polysaccharide export protein KpsE/RkpR
MAIKGFFSMFTSSEENLQKKNIQNVNPFRLTKKQAKIAKAIDKNVNCKVDKKTMVITIQVTDQNPVICATMADSVKKRLQSFITDYRTSKVRNDLAYNKKIFDEAKARYEKARDNYTRYSDTHRELSSQTALTKQSDLLNEMQIQQQLFQQVIAHVQQAEMKVQQETPAFTTLQSATVPVKKAGPSRAMICIVFLFLAFICTTARILYKEGDLKYFLGLS